MWHFCTLLISVVSLPFLAVPQPKLTHSKDWVVFPKFWLPVAQRSSSGTFKS